MFGFLNHSLLLRAGVAMGVITVMALAGMASAVYVARSTHGEAAAVNVAGSLRMQCYHISATVEASERLGEAFSTELETLIDEFETRLHSDALTRVIIHTDRQSLQKGYHRIIEHWQQSIRPGANRYLSVVNELSTTAEKAREKEIFHKLIENYVSDINHLVQLLEEDAESRIHMLGLMQGISLMITLTVAIITLYLLQTDVVTPLRDMLTSAERAGRGDFNARVAHVGDDELGRLGQAFNTMTSDLSKIYSELESRVAEKTEKLTERNRSLALLYSASRHLTEAPLATTTYHTMIDEISQILGGVGITLCLRESDDKRPRRIACSGTAPPMCNSESCKVCLGNGDTRLIDCSDFGEQTSILAIPVRDDENEYGVMLIEQPYANPPESWQVQLLETLGNHIGNAVGVSRRLTQRRRLALHDERSVIARELHDSLAQSLSYLKIQVTRLATLRGTGASEEAIDEVIGELKEGLSSAYRQLRELLTTFRLKMDGRGLYPALESTIAEFNNRGNVKVLLENRIDNLPLGVNEEIHVLQIIREALSNIINHSQASLAEVKLEGDDSAGIDVTIEDDGIGLAGGSERINHYGLAIMRERASSLDGELHIETGDMGGTRVRLHFQPNRLYLSQPPRQETSQT